MAAVLVRGFGMGRVGTLGEWGCWLVGGKEGERGRNFLVFCLDPQIANLHRKIVVTIKNKPCPWWCRW